MPIVAAPRSTDSAHSAHGSGARSRQPALSSSAAASARAARARQPALSEVHGQGVAAGAAPSSAVTPRKRGGRSYDAIQRREAQLEEKRVSKFQEWDEPSQEAEKPPEPEAGKPPWFLLPKRQPRHPVSSGSAASKPEPAAEAEKPPWFRELPRRQPRSIGASSDAALKPSPSDGGAVHAETPGVGERRDGGSTAGGFGGASSSRRISESRCS